MNQLTLYGHQPKKRSAIVESGALFSYDRKHRYALWRTWDVSLSVITFIGLNPSRANEINNDATITRCKNFAETFGYGSLYFMNLFSFRTPYVYKVPPAKKDKWRPLYDAYLVGDAWTEQTDFAFADVIAKSERVVCCWGSWPFITDRAIQVLSMIKEPYCFGVNKNGSPKHPLYLSSKTTLVKYEP